MKQMIVSTFSFEMIKQNDDFFKLFFLLCIRSRLPDKWKEIKWFLDD